MDEEEAVQGARLWSLDSFFFFLRDKVKMVVENKGVVRKLQWMVCLNMAQEHGDTNAG